jgi:hypothetical protein
MGVMLCIALCQSAIGQGKTSEATVLSPIELENVTLGEVIGAIGSKWNVNLISDAYLNDLCLKRLELKNIPANHLRSALEAVATKYGRRLFRVSGIYVLQDR